MSGLIRELRHAVRSLLRTPAFTVMTVGMLGLAIGANAGMFSVVNTVLLDPLPYENTDRLVRIASTAPGSDFPDEFNAAIEFYVQYQEESELLEDISTYNSFTSTLRTSDRVERIRMTWPTYTFFSTLGVRPILGRLPGPDDEDETVEQADLSPRQAEVINEQRGQAWDQLPVDEVEDVQERQEREDQTG